MSLYQSQMSKLIIRVPLVSSKNQFELQVRKSKEAKDFRVIAFSGKHYEMVHNYTHKDCAVRLKIISVNMSCNCQISPLERGRIPQEAYSLPQRRGFSSKEFQEAIWTQSRTMATKQSVPSISPANQPLERLDPLGRYPTSLFSHCPFSWS